MQFDDESGWSSPLVIVRKPDGSIRLVNNFINLNKVAVKEQNLTNNMSELVSKVAGSKYVSRIDLKSAYFQINVSPESRKYTHLKHI